MPSHLHGALPRGLSGQLSGATADLQRSRPLQATYTFSLPYVYTVQTSGLSFPVHIWYDAPNKRLRTDVYGGLDSTLTVEVRQQQKTRVTHT